MDNGAFLEDDILLNEVLGSLSQSEPKEVLISHLKPWDQGGSSKVFSLTWLKLLQSVFGGNPTVELIDAIRKRFPQWTMHTKRNFADFWLGSVKHRETAFSEASFLQAMPRLDKSACDVCHKHHDLVDDPPQSHPSPNSAAVPARPKKTASRSNKASSGTSSAGVSSKKTSKPLPVRKGTKRIALEQYVDDSEESDGASPDIREDSSDAGYCALYCPLTINSAEKRKPLLTDGLKHQCLRPDQHLNIWKKMDNDLLSIYTELHQHLQKTWFPLWESHKPKTGEDILDTSTTSIKSVDHIPPSRTPSISANFSHSSSSQSPYSPPFNKVNGDPFDSFELHLKNLSAQNLAYDLSRKQITEYRGKLAKIEELIATLKISLEKALTSEVSATSVEIDWLVCPDSQTTNAARQFVHRLELSYPQFVVPTLTDIALQNMSKNDQALFDYYKGFLKK